MRTGEAIAKVDADSMARQEQGSIEWDVSPAVLEVFLPATSHFSESIRRLFDVIVGAILLVISLPLFCIIALAVKITSRGPIIFRQKRAGLNGRIFTMYKFRTMYDGADDAKMTLVKLNEVDGPAFKIKNDPRVTPLGRFLRRSSMDELPQLINVLRGEMSLVGPRPLPVEEAKNIEGIGQLRMAVKPGLTCLWQISGRNELVYEKWVQLDLYYIRHRCLLLDIMILIQTIPAVLSAHGAY